MADRAHAQDLLSHLARMQLAGLPWLASLALWRDGCRRAKQRQAADRLMAHLRQGQSLTQALVREGWISGPLEALSQAAEASGDWAGQIDAWLVQAQQSKRLQRQLRSALSYPLLVLALSVLVISAVIAWVLPVFEGLYTHLPTTLPWATQALLWLRSAWATWITPLLWGVALMIVTIAWQWRHPQGRLRLELMVWRCPVVGQWWQMLHETRWCGLLAHLLEAGLDWGSALRLTGPTTGSSPLTIATGQTMDALTRGLGPADALALANQRWRKRCGRDLYSPGLIRWLKAAEATGTLPHALKTWSQSQSDTLLAQWGLSLRLLEPALMAVLGLFMGWLVLALYLPVMDMGQWL